MEVDRAGASAHRCEIGPRWSNISSYLSKFETPNTDHVTPFEKGIMVPDVHKEEVINASIAEVWEVWDDFGAIATWHPGLRKSTLLDQSPATGIGAKRRCDFANGKNFILEEIVEYESKRSMTVHIYDGNIPVQTSKVTFKLEALGPDRTRLAAEVDFKLKGGLLGSIAKPLAKKQLGNDISKLLRANRSFVERSAI